MTRPKPKREEARCTHLLYECVAPYVKTRAEERLIREALSLERRGLDMSDWSPMCRAARAVQRERAKAVKEKK